MAARAAFSPAGLEDVSLGLSPDWPDALASVALSLSLSATGGRLTGGGGVCWNGTGAWRASTDAFCTVAAGVPFLVTGVVMGAAGAGAATAFSSPVVAAGRGASAADCACGHGEATLCGAVVNRLALATPPPVIIRVATRMPRFICHPNSAPHQSKNGATSEALRADMA